MFCVTADRVAKKSFKMCHSTCVCLWTMHLYTNHQERVQYIYCVDAGLWWQVRFLYALLWFDGCVYQLTGAVTSWNACVHWSQIWSQVISKMQGMLGNILLILSFGFIHVFFQQKGNSVHTAFFSLSTVLHSDSLTHVHTWKQHNTSNLNDWKINVAQ